MEPARVSSPQVDLTRCGLDKTPALLILHAIGGGERLIKDLKRKANSLSRVRGVGGGGGGGEEFNHSIDLKRHARLAVAWSRHGSLVPRWT